MRRHDSFVWNAVLLACVASAFAACTGEATRGTLGPRPEKYGTLVQRAMAKDSTLDFLMLRLAFSGTRNYHPYEDPLDERRDTMIEAISANEYERAMVEAEAILAQNYVDIEAHIVGESACDALGDSVGSAQHFYMRDGLIQSLLSSGDGSSPATAIPVITVREEYTLMRAMGYEVEEQALIEGENGQILDLLHVVDPEEGTKRDFYFDVSIPFRWIGRHLR